MLSVMFVFKKNGFYPKCIYNENSIINTISNTACLMFVVKFQGTIQISFDSYTLKYRA